MCLFVCVPYRIMSVCVPSCPAFVCVHNFFFLRYVFWVSQVKFACVAFVYVCGSTSVIVCVYVCQRVMSVCVSSCVAFVCVVCKYNFFCEGMCFELVRLLVLDLCVCIWRYECNCLCVCMLEGYVCVCVKLCCFCKCLCRDMNVFLNVCVFGWLG